MTRSVVIMISEKYKDAEIKKYRHTPKNPPPGKRSGSDILLGFNLY